MLTAWGGAAVLDRHAARVLLAIAAVAIAVACMGPAPATARFYAQQSITPKGTTYCNYTSLDRYKVWCIGDYNVTAWVASNLTCSVIGTCMPAEQYSYMNCTNTTYCDRQRGHTAAEPACLVVQEDTKVPDPKPLTCDVEILGVSIENTTGLNDTFSGSSGNGSSTSNTSNSGWPTWKTITIIFSILGFFALLVVIVLALIFCARQRREVRTAPILNLTSLTATVDADMLVTVNTMPPAGAMGGGANSIIGPDGKPVQAPLPGQPSDNAATLQYPLISAPLVVPAAPVGAPARNTGDTLLHAIEGSRQAANFVPQQAPLVTVPPAMGVAQVPVPGGAMAPGAASYGINAAAAAAAAAATPQAAPGGTPGAATPSGGSISVSAAAGPGQGAQQQPPAFPAVPAQVGPAFMLPPTAATLQNPSGADQPYPPVR